MTRFRYKPPKRRDKLEHKAGVALRLIFLIILIAVAVWIILSLLSNRSKPAVVESKGSKGFLSDNKQDYTTEYFSFRAAGTWRLQEDSSSAKHFLYVNYRGAVAEEQLEVYIDVGPPQRATAYVVPVDIIDGSRFSVSPISEQCKVYVLDKNNRSQQNVTYLGTQFLCRPDSTVPDVVVGRKGGDTVLAMKRADGSTRNYFIYYRDSRFTPELDEINELLQSFKAL